MPTSTGRPNAPANRRGLGTALAIGGVLVIVVGLFALWQGLRDRSGEEAGSTPAGATAAYGALLGEKSAPHQVVIYEDFLCSHCADFAAASSDLLSKAIADGTASVEYRPFNLLGGYGDYSPRAVNAWAVVLDAHGPEVAARFHSTLMANQPSDPNAVSDESLIDLATSSGAEEAKIRDGITSERFKQWVVNATDQASKNGVTGTPTVLVDGESVDADPVALAKALG